VSSIESVPYVYQEEEEEEEEKSKKSEEEIGYIGIK